MEPGNGYSNNSLPNNANEARDYRQADSNGQADLGQQEGHFLGPKDLFNISNQPPSYDGGLRCVDEVIPQFRSIFASYPYFNKIQSCVLDDVLYSDTSVVVSAPTGSGKTVIFELAIVRFLINLQYSGQPMPYKIVYVAPMKALCEERVVDWHHKFGGLGLTCISVTGDSDNLDFHSLCNHNLIITTPEKWDSLTRRWSDTKKLATLVKLFMIDEVHLLGDEQRGPTLEAIVSRMKTIQDLLVPDNNAMDFLRRIRFVAVSATIPNVEDIAEWLSMPVASAKSFKFADDMRPVQLKKLVLGYRYSPQTSTAFKFDIMLNYKLQSILMQHAEGKPTLIFCSTRKSAEMTSQHITQNLTFNLMHEQRQILQAATHKVSDSKIKKMLPSGVCYHHAGLPMDDRKAVEELFRNASLPILVTTSTLAMGVNLPAHLVIVKSTKHYANGEYQDYSETMLQQMIGRAGRPQFDSSATAVILTTENDKAKYENMVIGSQTIESHLHKHLTEYLNAEVVLGTITDIEIAMHWINSMFLHIRARKRPRFYGLALGLTPEQTDKKLLEMCQIEINRLARAGMLTIDQNDITISPTITGSLMAKYCVAFETMKLFTKVSGKEILQQILSLISKCQEFSEIYLRVNDKKTLNLLNKCRDRETIRFCFNDKIRTVDMKINCIIQAVFGCLQIMQQSLVTESQKIMRIGERISNCLADYLETRGNCYSALLNALLLAKCFHTRLWENSPFVSRQLPGIGSVLSSALVTSGKTSFSDLLTTNPREIERIIGRKAPMGNTIQEQILHLPDYELILEKVAGEPGYGTFSVILRVRLKNHQLLKTNSTVTLNSRMNLLVGDTVSNKIFLYEKHAHSYLIENPEIIKTIDFPTTHEDQIQAHWISEDWVGFDCNATLVPEATGQTMKPETKNVENIEVQAATPSDKKDSSVKKASHIQTFVDRYFKKCKTKKPKRKQVQNRSSTMMDNPKRVDGNKDGTENVHLVPQVSDKLKISTAKSTTADVSVQERSQEPNQLKIDYWKKSTDQNQKRPNTADLLDDTKTQQEVLSEAEVQHARACETKTLDHVQKWIGDSISEYMKSSGNKSKQEASCLQQPKRFYLASETATQSFDITPEVASSANVSIIHSDSHSATARRKPEVTESVALHEEVKPKPGFTIASRPSPPLSSDNKFRLKKKLNCTVDYFENSLYDLDEPCADENNLHELFSVKFKYRPHKALNDSALNSDAKKPRTKFKQEEIQRQDLMVDDHVFGDVATKDNTNLQKTLTWRSPLVFSPAVKHSPMLNNHGRNAGGYTTGNANLSSSWTSSTPPSREAKINVKFSTSVSDSVSSGPSSTIQSDTSGARPTLRQNLFKTTPTVPLSDQAYSQSITPKSSSSTRHSSPFRKGCAPLIENEFVSTSLFEDLGFLRTKTAQSQTQEHPTSKTKDAGAQRNVDSTIPRSQNRPSVADYYSKLILDAGGKRQERRIKQAVVSPEKGVDGQKSPTRTELSLKQINDFPVPLQRQALRERNSQEVINQQENFTMMCDEPDFNFDPMQKPGILRPSAFLRFQPSSPQKDSYVFGSNHHEVPCRPPGNLYSMPRSQPNSCGSQKMRSKWSNSQLSAEANLINNRPLTQPRVEATSTLHNYSSSRWDFTTISSQRRNPNLLPSYVMDDSICFNKQLPTVPQSSFQLSEPYEYSSNRQLTFPRVRSGNFTPQAPLQHRNPNSNSLPQWPPSNKKFTDLSMGDYHHDRSCQNVTGYGAQFYSQQPSPNHLFHDYQQPTSQQHCCPRVSTMNAQYQRQPPYHNQSQSFENLVNLDRSASGLNIRRQTSNHLRVLPSTSSRKRSFHDTEPNFAHAYDHEDTTYSFYVDRQGLRPLKQQSYGYGNPYEHVADYEPCSSAYNEGDKQFLLQRYWDSVEERQMRQEVESQGAFQSAANYPLGRPGFSGESEDILNDKAGNLEDDDFSSN